MLFLAALDTAYWQDRSIPKDRWPPTTANATRLIRMGVDHVAIYPATKGGTFDVKRIEINFRDGRVHRVSEQDMADPDLEKYLLWLADAASTIAGAA